MTACGGEEEEREREREREREIERERERDDRQIDRVTINRQEFLRGVLHTYFH